MAPCARITSLNASMAQRPGQRDEILRVLHGPSNRAMTRMSQRDFARKLSRAGKRAATNHVVSSMAMERHSRDVLARLPRSRRGRYSIYRWRPLEESANISTASPGKRCLREGNANDATVSGYSRHIDAEMMHAHHISRKAVRWGAEKGGRRDRARRRCPSEARQRAESTAEMSSKSSLGVCKIPVCSRCFAAPLPPSFPC